MKNDSNVFCRLLIGHSSQGINARKTLHQYMEEAIKDKITRRDPELCEDALDYLIDSAKENGKELNMQELKVPGNSVHASSDLTH